MKHALSLPLLALLVTSGVAGEASAQVAPKPKLMKYGDHRTVWADHPIQAQYGDTQWRDFSNPPDGDADDIGDWRFPVAYKTGEKIRIARIEFRDAVPANPTTTLIDVRGTGPDGHVYFGSAQVAGDVVYATNLVSSLALQSKVRFYDTYDISWELIYFPNGQPPTTTVPAGTTRNKIYVAVNYEIQQTPYYLWESMLEISCQAANGMETTSVPPTPPTHATQAIASKIWDHFATLSVRRKATDGLHRDDGEPLVYWGPNATPTEGLGMYSEMLLNGWGKCGQWAQLLSACMELQGVPITRVGLVPKQPDSILVVREFATTGSNSSFPGYPYLWSDLDPMAGVPAQNNEDPDKEHRRFDNHCVNVAYGTILDPSYGVAYPDWHTYEDDVLFGLGLKPPVTGMMVYREQTPTVSGDPSELDLEQVGVSY